MGLALLLAIWFSGYLNKEQGSTCDRQSLYFIAGFALMSVHTHRCYENPCTTMYAL